MQLFKIIREPSRTPFDAKRERYTLGVMYRNGLRFCQTCEDEDRFLETGTGTKVAGLSAIPRGRYKIVNSFSHAFSKVLPEVLNVPGFSGVRIHGGNYAENSKGCILVGKIRIRDGIAQCPDIVQTIIDLIDDAKDERGEDTYLEVA